MVLSNKKLKQKLREAKTEQLTASEVQINSTNNKDVKAPQNPSAKTQESIQSLLKTVTQKPRLSKREKRREKLPSLPEKIKTLSVPDDGEVKKEGDENALNKKEKKKKRKRGEGEEKEGEDSVEGKEAKKAKNIKNKLKKKKKKRKGKKKVEDKEVKEEVVVSPVVPKEEQVVVETTRASESIANMYEFTKVYAGGIPYYSTEDDIRSYFESCGTITEIDCMFFPESGKFRGIAIISFKTEAAAKRALALDGSDMGGLYLKIQPYKSGRFNKTSPFVPAIVEGYNRIYVGNLSWDITEDDLRTLFSGCNITSIRFGEDKETKEFKGYGHVDFADSESVNVALKFDQHIVCGRPIRISRAVPKKGAAITNLPPIQQNDQVTTTDDDFIVQESEQVNMNEVKPISVSQPNDVVTTTSNEVAAVVSSKIRRRTCYECGERGHLSSSCPKKQESDQLTAVAT